MAVVGTAYVHVKALANNMAKDMEDQLQPLAQKFKDAGQEASQNFAEEFNKGVGDSLKNNDDMNIAEGLSDRAKPELEELEKEFERTEKKIVDNNRSSLKQLAENFKNTGKKSSNNFIQNFGMGMWFNLVHKMYDLFLFVTPAIGAAGGAITQLVGGLYSMVGALGPVVSTVGVLPGMYYSFAGALIATNIGLKDSLSASQLGFKAAKAVATGSKDAGAAVQKYQEALKGLGPEARKFTETLVGMSGTFQDISANIQTALLPDLTKALEILQKNGIIDGFGRSFEGLAGVVGTTALQIASLTNQPFFKGKLGEALQSSTTVAGYFGSALSNLVQSLVLVAAAAAPVTEEFARWISTVTGGWASKATNDFDGLRAGIQRGADMAKLMGEILGNLWGTLTGLGKAGSDAGRGLWESFRDVTQEWENFVNSVEGQKTLETFFENAANGTRAVGNAFRALGRVMGELGTNENVGKMLEGLTPMIEQFGDMLVRMVDEAGPALGEMVDALLDLLDTITEGQGISAFADTITVFAKALNGLLNLPGGHQILIFLATFIGIFKASSIIAQVTGFRGAVSGLFKTLQNVKTSGGVSSWIRGISTQMKDGKKVTTGYAAGMTGSMRAIAGSVKRGAVSAGKGFASLGTTMVSSVRGPLDKSFGTIHKQVNGFGKSATTSATKTGKGMGAGLALGFRNTGQAIGGAAKSAAGGVSGAFVAAGTKSKNAMNKAGSSIKSGFGKTMGAIGKLNPFGAILTAIELLIPIFITLYQTSDTFRNAVNGAFKAIGDAIQPVLPILQNLFEQVSGVFSGLLESVGPPLMDAFGSIVSSLGPVLGTIGQTLGDVFSQIGPVIGQMASSIGPLLSSIGQTIGGVFSQLGPVIGQIVGQIGPLASSILPVLGNAFTQIVTAVQPLLPMLGQLVGTVLSSLGGILGSIVPIFGQFVGMVVQVGSQLIGALIPPLVQLVSSVLPVLVTVFQSLFPVFTTLISTLLPPLINLLGTVLPAVIGFLMPIITAVISAIVPIIQGLMTVLTGVITFLTGVFTGNWSMAWEGIKQIFVGLWNTLVAVVTGVWGVLVSIVTGIWNAIKGVTTAVFTAIGSFFVSIWNGYINTVRTVATAIVSFAINKWNQMKASTLQVYGAIRSGITTAINAVKSVVTKVVTAVVSTAINKWNQMKATTLRVFAAIKSGISSAINGAKSVVSSAVNGIKTSMTNAWNAVKNATTRAWSAMKSAISNGISGAVSLVRSLPGKFKSAMGNAGSLLRGVGSNIVRGLVNGLKSGLSWVTSTARNLAKSAVNAAKGALGIKSPSRVFKEIGGYVGKGFVKGLKGSESSVSAASKKLADMVTKAYNSKKLSKGTYNRTMKVIKSGNKKMLGLAGQRAVVAEKLKKANEKLTEATKLRNDFATGLSDKLIGTLDLGDITKKMDFNTVLGKFKDATTQVKKFSSDMAKLRKMGLDQDLYEQITQAGAERGSELAASLLQKGQSGINQINQQFRDLERASASAGGQSADYLYKSGVDSAKGLIKGLKSQEKSLAKQAERMAKIISKSVKKALRIKSPSRIMADLGGFTAEGLIKGMDDMQSNVSASAENMGKATVAGAKKAMTLNTEFANMSLRSVATPVAPISATLDSNTVGGSAWDTNPILSPQNQALVNALSQYVGTEQTNYFNIQKDKDIRTLAVEISRELERTK